jgi:phosphoribosylaminoimidazolecarboxamide formyltransferase/IMP cyclohydrolase
VPRLAVRQLSDSYLVQESYSITVDPKDWTVVTTRQPTESEMRDAQLAWVVSGHVTSNAIVLAKDGVAWGIGAGQQNRVEAGQLATQKAAGRAAGGACASDAFYPFADGIDAAAAAGVTVVIQPGGSVNDDVVIDAANGHDLAMIFTGERQFRH